MRVFYVEPRINWYRKIFFCLRGMHRFIQLPTQMDYKCIDCRKNRLKMLGIKLIKQE